MLHKRGLTIKPKPFAIGLRIEHKAEMINRSQYRDAHNHPKLPTARYKLVAHLPDKRSVYTFCMCPGGVVVAATSEENQVVVNGMSEYARDGENSNSAIIVQVNPEDFGSDHPELKIRMTRSPGSGRCASTNRRSVHPSRVRTAALRVGVVLAVHGGRDSQRLIG